MKRSPFQRRRPTLSGRGVIRVVAGVVVAGFLAGPGRLAAQAVRSDGVATSVDTLRPIIVASKPFAESFILAEVFAQLLEERGYAVERRPGLGATEIAFQALRTGAIDVYPEYTGTGVQAILGENPSGGPLSVFQHVSREFRDRWGVRWLAPLGFENTYAIAVRPETADRLGLASLSDLAEHGGELVGGLTPDFIGRADGLPGMARAYGLEFGDVRPLMQALKYQAVEQGDVDVIDGYSTDAGIERAGLRVLIDDLGFFPPYEAAALVGSALASRAPDALAVLGELSGRIDVAAMRRMNAAVEMEGRSIEAVAAEFLAGIGLTNAVEAPGGPADSGHAAGPFAYLIANRDATLRQTGRHLFLVGVSLALALLIAIPTGLVLERVSSGASEAVVRGAGVLQTIPSIALLAFMIPLLGIGVVPAIVALFLYSLFPILRNTYTGVRDADPEAVAAARALGMTPRQILLQIRLPLAAPVLMAGVRTAAVINVGTATLAAFIGAGGLGDPIAAGLALSDPDRVLAGAVPAAILALLVDFALARVERGITPGGLTVGPGD